MWESDFAAQAVPLEEVLAAPDGEVGDEASLEPTAGGEGGPGGGIYLNATGRKIFLQEFYARLREELYYPPRQGTYAWREIIREQGYHLARVIEGQEPGYQPFVPS